MGTYMLTTIDNPYNPFEEFNSWFVWDTKEGHHSLSLLARIVMTSDNLSEVDQDLAVQQAIEEIVRENVSGVHKKVEDPSLGAVPQATDELIIEV